MGISYSFPAQAAKRRIAALLSKPEAVGDRPPPALPAAPGPPPTAGLKVAGVRRFGTAALGASGAFGEIREDALVVLEHDRGPARPRGKVPRLDLRLVQGADIGRVMPLLRPANRERFAALAEPVRDRNKVWRLESFRFEWRKKPRRLKLGRYPPKRVATALFNGARDRTNYEGFVGCAAATEVLERRCYILSRSYCHVTLLGVGFAGRIYVPTHAINAINRCLKLRCYVAECAQYCETTLGTRDVEALFGHEPFREEPKGKPGHFDARLVRRYLDELRTNPQANDPNPPQKLRVRLPTRLYRAVKALRSVVRGHPDNFYTLVTVEQPRDRLLFLIEILDGSCEQIPLKWSSEQQSHLANSLEAVTAEELKVQMDVMLASIAVKDRAGKG